MLLGIGPKDLPLCGNAGALPYTIVFGKAHIKPRSVILTIGLHTTSSPSPIDPQQFYLYFICLFVTGQIFGLFE